MKKVMYYCLCALLLSGLQGYSQNKKVAIMQREEAHFAQVEKIFQTAYARYPAVPRGVLEAVSYYYTRYSPVKYEAGQKEDLTAIPATYGLMGLTLNGKGVFRNNLEEISRLSGIPVERILADDEAGVCAYAAAFSELQQRRGVTGKSVEECAEILLALSELPLPAGAGFDLPTASQLYALYTFLADSGWCARFHVPVHSVDFGRLFGENLKLLHAPRLQWDVSGAPSARSASVGRATAENVDYGNALWVPAGSCNYTSMSSRTPTSITIHYTAGTYSGAIAWFRNCTYNGVGAQVSAHYVIRSFDGQVTQMVREKDKAWHVGSANGYTIGLEHEAYGNVQDYFTPEMYASSADLVRDICERHQINPLRMFYRDTLDDGTLLNKGLHDLGNASACTKIRGHQHYPNQTHTDPGPYWDWNYYFKLVNPAENVVVLSADSGVLTDSGGEDGNYGCDERKLYQITVPNAEKIILEFEEFELEKDYDFLWIYKGNSLFSPLIGRWNTQSPGRIEVDGNSVLLEFRSDCGITARGWRATWHAQLSPIPVAPIVPADTASSLPETDIVWNNACWITHDTSVQFRDVAQAGVKKSFYQILNYNGIRWVSDADKGFLCDNFDNAGSMQDWTTYAGMWAVHNARLEQRDTSNAWAHADIQHKTAANDAFLYDVYVNVLGHDGDNGYFTLAFSVDDAASMSNGYEVRFYPRLRKMVLYRLKNGTCFLLYEKTGLYITENRNYLYRIYYDRAHGEIAIFRHGTLLGAVQAVEPLLSAGTTSFVLGTSNCAAAFDNVRCYGARNASVDLTVGQRRECDLQYQAVNGHPRTKLKSIVLDELNQFSTLKEKTLLVDYVAPSLSGSVTIRPELLLAYGTVYENFVASWNSGADSVSGVAGYEICLSTDGIVPERNDSRWRAVGTDTTLRNTIPCIANQYYRLYVRCVDSAGWRSCPICSERFRVVKRGGQSLQVNRIAAKKILYAVPDDEKNVRSMEWNVYPNPVSDCLNVEGLPVGTKYVVVNALGKMFLSGDLSAEGRVNLSSLQAGMYVLKTEYGNKILLKF